MKSAAIILLMTGAVFFGISSCATTPRRPLFSGELRLLRILIPDKEKIRVNQPFAVNIRFEAEGPPEMRSACFYFADDGPHCFKITDVEYGPPGTIRMRIQARKAGSRLLECYVLYMHDGKIQPTNVVSAYLSAVPQ